MIDLPFEDREAGFYVNRWSERTPEGVVLTVIEHDGVEPTYLVPVGNFMAMQKERDDLRRVAGLVNAWRVSNGIADSSLANLFGQVGFDWKDGEAMLSIVRGMGKAL